MKKRDAPAVNSFYSFERDRKFFHFILNGTMEMSDFQINFVEFALFYLSAFATLLIKTTFANDSLFTSSFFFFVRLFTMHFFLFFFARYAKVH